MAMNYDSCLNVTGGSIDFKHIPENVELHDNYPNPFNPVTIIKYDLPNATMVKLAIYDLLGKEMAVLVDGYRDWKLVAALLFSRFWTSA